MMTAFHYDKDHIIKRSRLRRPRRRDLQEARRPGAPARGAGRQRRRQAQGLSGYSCRQAKPSLQRPRGADCDDAPHARPAQRPRALGERRARRHHVVHERTTRRRAAPARRARKTSRRCGAARGDRALSGSAVPQALQRTRRARRRRRSATRARARAAGLKPRASQPRRMHRHRHDQIGRHSIDPLRGVEEQRAEKRLGGRIEAEQTRARVLESLDEALDLSFVGRFGHERGQT